MTHPTTGHLAAHAAGSLPSGMSLLVASHLTYCPRCRDRLARLETLGGAFLLDPPAPKQASVPPPDLAATLARIGVAPEAVPAPEVGDEAALPAPVRTVLRDQGRRLRWRRILPGLADCPLPGDSGEDVRLVRARPGVGILSHTHEGEEATLLFRGQLRDGARVFGRGDVSLCGPEHDHQPRAVGEETCLCLVVLTGRLHFTGRLGRILNLVPH